MTKKEAFKILRITHDIKYTYKNDDGSVNFMTIIDTYKAQAEADMRVGTYTITQAEIDEAYDYLQSEYNYKMTGAKTTEKGKSKVVPILITTAAIITTGALVVTGISMLSRGIKNQGSQNVPGIVQEDDKYTDGIADMGDLNDSKAVEQRATEIVEMFNKNGIVHSETNNPYTVEEIKVILHYMNGGLLPEDVTPDAANTSYLNMIADMFNTKIVLYNAAYMAGAQIIEFDKNGNIVDYDGKVVDMSHIDFDPSTGLTIINSKYAHLYSKNGLGTSEQHYKRAVDSYVAIDVTDFQFGNSTAFPYLEWFCNKYNKLMTTTDKKEKVEIFNELTQSLADIVYGKGFSMTSTNGESLLIQYNDFADIDDVNDYNALRIVVSLYQGARAVVDQEDYELGRTDELIQTKDVYRIITTGGIADVHIDDVLGAFNAACDNDDKDMNIYDENGNLINGDNLDQRAYSNTIMLLNENDNNNDLSNWTNRYRK